MSPATPIPSVSSPTSNVVRLLRPPSDAQLVESIREGDAEALGVLFDRHGERIRRTIWRVLGPDSEADDILQDVFLVAMERMHQLADPAALASWLTSIAVFTARSRIRKRQRWRGFLVFSTDTVARTCSDGSDHDHAASDEHRALYDVLDRMPADERIVLCLRFLDEMQIGEIAEVCGVSHATAKRRVAKARARFDRLAERQPALRGRMEGPVP